jgi:spore coat protein A
LIQDRLFNSDGSLNYNLTGGMMGGMDNAFMGDTILVNGAIQPYLRVGTRKVRFRILNGSNARRYLLSLSTGRPFIQIGTDGGLLPKPVTRSSINIYPGERVDLIIDFSVYPVGTQIVLKNSAGSGRTGTVMRFDVTRKETDDSTVPATLRPFDPITPKTAVMARNFTLSTSTNGIWVINGLGYDPARIDASPKIGSIEIWRFINRSGMVHPMHVHGVKFQILDINGRPPSAGSGYDGWKDTVQVPAWGEVRVIARFSGFPGIYAFHCHILEHEDRAMMSQYQVVE